MRQPFNVNTVAQAAALAALMDERHIKRTVENNSKEKKRMIAELERMGLRIYPTQANFILIDTGRSGKEVFERLLRKGVIVRFMGAPLERHIRVTIGTPEQNDIFLNSMKEVLEEMSQDV